MSTNTYDKRRDSLEIYFDRTAVDGWKKLVSKDEKVSRIRATVRAGRDQMRNTILSYFEEDLTGCRILDAGCGGGSLSIELAKRGADVTGVDLSPEMIKFATEHAPKIEGAGRLTFVSGDMLSRDLGKFDAVVSMDSLIHYNRHDVANAVEELASRTSQHMVFTIAPKTAALTALWMIGKALPRGDRSPAIEPIKRDALISALGLKPSMAGWHAGRSHRVSTAFYKSEAVELVKL
ncbi:MAG: magnesium protoporphyrin IX methyltransferase [Ahrensia sp.]|nr:magnesium protoporphyrin IX methyltransferase [Ahrensia sp.]